MAAKLLKTCGNKILLSIIILIGTFFVYNKCLAADFYYYASSTTENVWATNGIASNPAYYYTSSQGIERQATTTFSGSWYVYFWIKRTENVGVNCRVYARYGSVSGSTITHIATSSNEWEGNDAELVGNIASTSLTRFPFAFSGSMNSGTTYYIAVGSHNCTAGSNIYLQNYKNNPAQSAPYSNIWSFTQTIGNTINTRQNTYRIQVLMTTDIPYQLRDTEIIELPDQEVNIQIGSEEDIIADQNNYCTINNTCTLPFRYGYQSIGYDVYLVPDIEGYKEPDHSTYLPRELINANILKDYFLIDNETQPTTNTYCLYLDRGDNDSIYCGINVIWKDQADTMFYGYEYDLDSACDDVATSTGGFDDFRYGFECGFRKVIYWSFTPHPSTVNRLQTAYTGLKKTFPFSLVYQITNEIDQAQDEITISATTTFNIPFIEKTATGTQFISMPIVSSTSMPNLIGSDNNAAYRMFFTGIFWAAVVFFIVLIILKT